MSRVTCGLCLALLIQPTPAAGEAQRAEAVIAGDYFAAGDEPAPGSAIEGDAFIAGADVSLPVPVDGDAVLAGGRVTVSARVGSDLYAAGAAVSVDAPVLRNARLAGRGIHLTNRSDIAGRVTAAGKQVLVEGAIGGQLTVFGESVTLDGRLGSGVVVFARSLRVGPNARIHGRLTYRTEKPPSISPQAEILGGVKESGAKPPGLSWEPWARIAAWMGALALSIGMFVVGVLAIVVAPSAAAAVTRTIAVRPVASLFTGLALVVLTPVVVALLFASVVGIPLGLAALFLWPVLLLFGYLSGALFLADSLAGLVGRFEAGTPPSTGLRIVFLALVLIAVLLLAWVPLIGWLVGALLLVLGSGAILLAVLARRTRGPQVRPKASV
ncbi:MAG TPA: hypothetical protein VNM24_04885 [Burkholderiales bacterium]|nr:hypothetical protein [Burkholderiales bacterium]